MRPLVLGGVGGGTCRVAFMLRNLANFQKMKPTPDAAVFASLINNSNQETSVVSAALSRWLFVPLVQGNKREKKKKKSSTAHDSAPFHLSVMHSVGVSLSPPNPASLCHASLEEAAK